MFLLPILLTFVIGSAFAPSDSTSLELKQDTTSVAEINIRFDKVTVEQKTVNLEHQLEQQRIVDQELISSLDLFTQELSSLNAKIPDMTVTPVEVKLQALEEEFGINKEEYKQSIAANARQTNFTNFLIFVLGLGTIWWFGYSKRVKRVPDLALHLTQGVCTIGAIFLLRFFILSGLAVLNPTYQIIQQLSILTG